MKQRILFAFIIMLFVVPCFTRSTVYGQQLSAKDIGLTLIALAPEDLDAIQRASGYRVGVMVIKVEENSPAQKAGLKKGDMILALGSKGTDSPKAAVDALAGKTGKMDVALLRTSGEGDLNVLKLTLEIPAAPAPEGAGSRPAPEASPKPLAEQADIQTKLKALENARNAGVLSDDEYSRKKAELNAKLQQTRQQPDAATQRKLKALDDARKAGVLSDDEYAKKRNELIGTAAVTDTKAPATAPLIPATKGKIFRHPIGFEFVQPADWSVQEQGDMLLLTPANQAKNAQGPLEVYLITGERVDTEGIRQPDDPRVTSYLDQMVKQMLPTLNRTGQADSLDTSAGKAVILDWIGKNPQGQEVLARCYVNIIRGHGVTLAGVGLKDKVVARDAVLRRMFVSFGMSEGKLDPELAGRWSLTGTYSLTNWSVYESSWTRARMVTDASTTLMLGGNGSWNRTYESQTLAGAGGIWLESSDRKVSRGKWYAGDGLLYLVTDDDLWETYKYKLEQTAAGRQLRLASEKTGTSWKEVR
jgi:hypothetical protein